MQAAPVADLTMTLSALYPVSMFLALDGNCTAYCVCAFPLIFYGAQRRRLLRGKWIFVFTDVQCMLFGMDGIGAVTWALQNSAGGNNRWPAGFIVAFVYALTPALVFAICVRFRLRERAGQPDSTPSDGFHVAVLVALTVHGAAYTMDLSQTTKQLTRREVFHHLSPSIACVMLWKSVCFLGHPVPAGGCG